MTFDGSLVYRDGDCLVWNYDSHVGRLSPANGEYIQGDALGRANIRGTPSNDPIRVTTAALGVVGAVMDDLSTTEISMKVPSHRDPSISGGGILAAIMAIFLIPFGLFFALLGLLLFSSPEADSWKAALAVSGLGGGTAIFGAVIFYAGIKSKSWYEPKHKMKILNKMEKWYWIHGADQTYLDQLPQWPGLHQAEKARLDDKRKDLRLDSSENRDGKTQPSLLPVQIPQEEPYLDSSMKGVRLKDGSLLLEADACLGKQCVFTGKEATQYVKMERCCYLRPSANKVLMDQPERRERLMNLQVPVIRSSRPRTNMIYQYFCSALYLLIILTVLVTFLLFIPFVISLFIESSELVSFMKIAFGISLGILICTGLILQLLGKNYRLIIEDVDQDYIEVSGAGELYLEYVKAARSFAEKQKS